MTKKKKRGNSAQENVIMPLSMIKKCIYFVKHNKKSYISVKYDNCNINQYVTKNVS